MNRQLPAKKGTVNIHGKEYHTVALRTQEFRKKYPIDKGYGIVTSLLSSDEKGYTVYAQITAGGVPLATGLAREEINASRINKTSALENAETSAIGRALAACGFGTEGTYSSADEICNALESQKTGGFERQEPPQAPPAKPESSVEKFLDSKMGFAKTGTLTWRDAAEDIKSLVDGKSARQYLDQLAAWENKDPSKGDVSRKAKVALEFVLSKKR